MFSEFSLYSLCAQVCMLCHDLSACLLRYCFGVSLECTAVQGRGTGMMPTCMYSLFATTDVWLTEHQTCRKAWLKHVCFGFGLNHIIICSSIGVNRSLYWMLDYEKPLSTIQAQSLNCFTSGTVALITIESGAQIHPLIATRWCSSLKGKNLRYVMVANHGYLPDKVNFAARIAKNRVNPDVPLDLIASFKAAAQTDPGGCT